jgi:hypothetical protein
MRPALPLDSIRHALAHAPALLPLELQLYNFSLRLAFILRSTAFMYSEVVT